MIETGLLEVARSPALLSTAACLLLAFILRLVLGQSQKLKIPVSTLKDGNVTKSIMDGRDQVCLEHCCNSLFLAFTAVTLGEPATPQSLVTFNGQRL
jgi:hypothetical protein